MIILLVCWVLSPTIVSWWICRYPERPLSLLECRLTSVPANSGTPYVLFSAKVMPKFSVNFSMTLLKIGHMGYFRLMPIIMHVLWSVVRVLIGLFCCLSEMAGSTAALQHRSTSWMLPSSSLSYLRLQYHPWRRYMRSPLHPSHYDICCLLHHSLSQTAEAA